MAYDSPGGVDTSRVGIHTPGRNIELKARLRCLEDARRTAQQLATETPAAQRQVDTYFHCSHGRLKLRQIDDDRAELIWYERPDLASSKASDYRRVAIADPAGLLEALEAALGVRTIVRKRREIFLHHNVRIHLDQVEGLGDFLEFEAVIAHLADDRRGYAQLEALSKEFAIVPSDLLVGSYGEMAAPDGGCLSE